MLGIEESWGADRSIMKHFLSEYFLVVTPMGLTLEMEKGDFENGPTM